MNYRHIVFDVEGTLLNSADSDLSALQDTIKELTGRVIPISALIFSQGIPGPATLTRLGMDNIPVRYRLELPVQPLTLPDRFL